MAQTERTILEMHVSSAWARVPFPFCVVLGILGILLLSCTISNRPKLKIEISARVKTMNTHEDATLIVCVTRAPDCKCSRLRQ